MKISLRKSNALQLAIQENLRVLTPVTSTVIDEYVNIEDTLSTARVNVSSNVAKTVSLLDALFEIRKSVSIANHARGINDRLGEVAKLEKLIQIYQVLVAAPPVQNLDVLKSKLEKIRTRPETGYGNSSTVQTGVLTKEDLEDYKSTLNSYKKSKQKLQDELLHLNISVEIELTEQTVSTLTEQELI